MVEKVKLAVMAIVELIKRLKAHYDGQREKLTKLQEQLNALGDPGCDFCDESYNHICSGKGNTSWYCLFYERGKLVLLKHESKAKDKIPLAQIQMDMVERTLERLPVFLERYQTFLEGREKTHKLNLDKLTQIVQAISSIMAK